jgi:S-adenosylmethionine synthetase
MNKGKDSLDMSMRRPLYGGMNSAAEFVTPGHPDKTCDQIACRILDQAIKINPNARVAIEMVACDGIVTVGGEISKDLVGKINIEKTVREVFEGLGYTRAKFSLKIGSIVNTQSSDIAQGVNRSNKVVGAGDQGVMCGYAMYAPEREHMPAAFWYAQQLAMKLFDVAMEKTIPDLFADGKTQVIIRDGKISHVTIAIQHDEKWKLDKLKNAIIKHVIKPVAGNVPSVKVNGTGKFVKGSIWADSAEVGRKIVVDQMGPDVPVGGGTMCGKDPTKVDITAALMARHIAKSIVANKLANEALVQFAFTIGQPAPDLMNVYAPDWRGKISPQEWCLKNFPVTVAEMIDHLQLRKPRGWSYEEASKFGFYGHPNFSWEKVTKIN